MAHWKIVVAAATLAALLGCQSPEDPTLEFSYWYFVTLPENYEQVDKCPMILFLHGAGGATTSLAAYEWYGLGDYAKTHDDFPFVVVAPQTENGWLHPESIDEVLNKVQSEYKIDSERIYVTGFSMGGGGTFLTSFAFPHRFAAIAPVAGWGDSTKAASIAHLPVWIFHDSGDPDVPFDYSQQMYDALVAVGGNVRMTVYNNNVHDAWHETYANPELYAWFLGCTRIPEPDSIAMNTAMHGRE
jgi:predicted peptidase